jgi:hypothetical protein
MSEGNGAIEDALSPFGPLCQALLEQREQIAARLEAVEHAEAAMERLRVAFAGDVDGGWISAQGRAGTLQGLQAPPGGSRHRLQASPGGAKAPPGGSSPVLEPCGLKKRQAAPRRRR